MATIAACSYSSRVRLEPLIADDAEQIQALGDDPSVFRFVPQIAQPFDAKCWVGVALDNAENYIRHTIRLRDDGQIIGYVQINRRRNAEIELGYWLGRAYWGRSFALEAAASALVLFGTVAGRHRVFAAVSTDNVASVRILNRLGFSQCKAIDPHAGVVDGMNDYVLHL